MKKNVMMRVASALLVAVLLTTCAISGTFAKYTTYGESTDDARVAKWGVVVTADFSGLFTDTYTTTDTWTDDDGVSVKTATTDENLVAPGTDGTLADFTVTGTPEVDVNVSYDATLTLTGWTIDTDVEYCPIIINVNDEDYYVGKDGIANVAALVTAVEEAIEASTAKYDALTDLSAVVKEDLAVTWRWEFEADTITTQTDINDTKLGDLANAPTIDLAVKCTIDQIN